MKHLLKRPSVRCWLICLAALTGTNALAQALVDPTRPPDERLSGTDAAVMENQPASGLQLVISSPGRQLALVDGQLLKRGHTLNGNTLIQANQHQAVVRKDGERVSLSLHPQVKKTLRPPYPGQPRP